MPRKKIPRADQSVCGNQQRNGPVRTIARGQRVVRSLAGIDLLEQLESRTHLTAVTNFALIDATADREIGTLTNGAVINLAQLPSRQLNVRVDVDSTTESVAIARNGTHVRVENFIPFAFAGNRGADFIGWTPGVGTHTISATPYSQDARQGVKGPEASVTFMVVDQVEQQAVTGFTLFNAVTNQPIQALTPGAVIDLAQLPTRQISIRADTTSDVLGSVRFALNGNSNFYTDNSRSYYIRGDNGRGDVYSWRPAAGNYTLTATPFGQDGAKGTAGVAASIGFTVVDGTSNLVPTVSIISPSMDDRRVGLAYYVVAAEAFDSDGSISKVEFYVGNTLLGVATAEPYSISWLDVLPGSYTLTALAYDNAGAVETSSAVNVTVTQPTTIGKTYYISPFGNDKNAGTSVLSPFRTINRAVKLVQPGDTILLADGVYREQVLFLNSGTPTHPITIKAMNPGNAIIDGSDLITGWTRTGGSTPVYTAPWAFDFFMGGSRSFLEPGLVGNAEQFIYNGKPLTMVGSSTSLTPGTFWVNYDANTVSVYLPDASDPNAGAVYGSSRNRLLGSLYKGKGQYVRVEGLTLRHASNFAQANNAALRTENGWVVIDTVVKSVNGAGIGVLGRDVVLIRTQSLNNGQSGIASSRSERALLFGTESGGNNYKGFRPQHEAGGGKWALTDYAYIQNHYAHDNQGHGLWFDIENTNFTIINSRFTGQYYRPEEYFRASGIHIEISPGPGRIEGNTIWNNMGPGVKISESQKISILNNSIYNNAQAIEIRGIEGRPVFLFDLTITGNRFGAWRLQAILASNGLWDENAEVSKKIFIDNNLYDSSSGTMFLRLGGKNYTAMSAVGQAFGWETNGQIGAFNFVAPV